MMIRAKTILICLLSAAVPTLATAQEDTVPKPKGNWQEIDVQDMDIRELGNALGIDLTNAYLKYRQDVGIEDSVKFKVSRPDINKDGKVDLILFIESPYDCGQIGCTINVYTAPLEKTFNPFDEEQPTFSTLAMDVLIDPSVKADMAELLVYNGVNQSYVPFSWDGKRYTRRNN